MGESDRECPGTDENSRMIHVSQGPISPHLDNLKRWPSSFLGWLTYGITFSCLLYLRIKKNLPRPYKVPIIIPATMVLTSVYLVLAPIVAHPQPEFLYVFLFLLSGFLVYFLFVYFWYQPECLQVVTLHLQLLMEVAPTMKNAD